MRVNEHRGFHDGARPAVLIVSGSVLSWIAKKA
jgi:hypothetical protein